jgi:hypothetical protein
MKRAYRILAGKSQGRRQPGVLGTNRRILKKMDLEEFRSQVVVVSLSLGLFNDTFSNARVL